MATNHNTRQRHRAKSWLLVVACLLGLVAAVEATGSVRAHATASGGDAPARYPKAASLGKSRTPTAMAAA